MFGFRNEPEPSSKIIPYQDQDLAIIELQKRCTDLEYVVLELAKACTVQQEINNQNFASIQESFMKLVHYVTRPRIMGGPSEGN